MLKPPALLLALAGGAAGSCSAGMPVALDRPGRSAGSIPPRPERLPLPLLPAKGPNDEGRERLLLLSVLSIGMLKLPKTPGPRGRGRAGTGHEVGYNQPGYTERCPRKGEPDLAEVGAVEAGGVQNGSRKYCYWYCYCVSLPQVLLLLNLRGSLCRAEVALLAANHQKYASPTRCCRIS